MSDPTISDDAERELLDAEASMRRAMGLFGDCTSEALLRFAQDNAPTLTALGKAVGDNAQHVVGCRFGDEKRMEIHGIVYERSRPGPTRSGWNKDELWEDAKDSVRHDPDSGERVIESEFDKYRRIFPAGSPRVGVLDEYRIDRDKHCHVTWPDQQNWKVVPLAEKQRRRRK